MGKSSWLHDESKSIFKVFIASLYYIDRSVRSEYNVRLNYYVECVIDDGVPTAESHRSNRLKSIKMNKKKV